MNLALENIFLSRDRTIRTYVRNGTLGRIRFLTRPIIK